MKRRIAAMAILVLTASAASAQQPAGDHPGPRGPGGFGLLEFDMNADGRLTKSEVDAALRARFDKIDANKDGAASREELKAFREAEVEAHKSARAKARFAELDTDKNGQLSQAEFLAGLPGPDDRGGPDEHGRPPLFGPFPGAPPRFLADGSPRGFGPGDRPPHGDDGQKSDRGSKRAGPGDANGDGKVTFAEFSEGPFAAFNRADANKDGTVTIAELQALHGGKR